jgi:hypothetical protein
MWTVFKFKLHATRSVVKWGSQPERPEFAANGIRCIISSEKKYAPTNLMKSIPLLPTLVVSLATSLAPLLADQPSLDPHLEILRPMLEKTWKGHFKDSKPDKPVVDVARWERALNGKAVRIMHSVNDGIYGGETIVTWDEGKQSLVYHYFTTAGHNTVGTMSSKDGKFATEELVTGSSGGVTEVKATTELLAGGTLHVKAEYLKNGEWAPGHEVFYKEDPSAKVVFK